MPNVEDILASDTFGGFYTFLEARDLDADECLRPLPFLDLAKSARASMCQVQRGHFFSRTPFPQLIPLGLGPQEHFEKCLQTLPSTPFPHDAGAVVELDARFAAFSMASACSTLEAQRQAWYAPLTELARRLDPLTSRLRRFRRQRLEPSPARSI